MELRHHDCINRADNPAAGPNPAALLSQLADDYEALMIVVGSRGEGWRAGLGRHLIAPVSHQLIAKGRHPVLVVSEQIASLS